MNRSRFARASASAALVAGLLAGCGGEDTPPAPEGTLSVVAGFYPLQFVTERVGGDQVSVTNLTKPGAEPHDLELAPADVAELAGADLVVYQSALQPAVDEAVAQQVDDAKAFDVATAARLESGQAEAGDAGDEEHAEGGADPHFWLDPTRLAAVGDAVAERLAEIAPDRASTFQANAAELTADLDELDGRYAAILSSCTSRELVTAHDAFGYLARRYELTQVGIAGLSPDTEPTARKLAEVSAFVKDNQVSTIFYETLLSPEIAETVAKETGADTAVLDPLEGIADTGGAKDYFTVMRANLDALQKGLRCE